MQRTLTLIDTPGAPIYAAEQNEDGRYDVVVVLSEDAGAELGLPAAITVTVDPQE